MTVTVDQDIETFNGNGATTSFPFSVISQAVTDVYATHISTTLVRSKLVRDTDFSVTLNSDGTSTITFPLGGSSYSTLATGEQIEIRRIVPLTQSLSLSNHGPYNAQAVENALDKLTQAIQQFSPDNPSADGNIIYFDSDGVPQKGITYVELKDLASASNYYNVPVTYDAGETYTTPQTTVIQGGVIYAPKFNALPIGPEAFNSSNWYVVQGYVSGSGANLDVGGTFDVTGIASFADDVLIGGASGDPISGMTGVGMSIYGSNSTGIGFESGATLHQYRAWLNGSGDFQISNTYLGGTAPFRIFPAGNSLVAYEVDITPNSSANREQFCLQGNGYQGYISFDATDMYLGHHSSARGLALQTDETSRIRISGAGNIYFGPQTTPSDSSNAGMDIKPNGGANGRVLVSYAGQTTNTIHIILGNGNGVVGSISTNGSATAFNTTSDPRLKSQFTKVSPETAVDMIKEAYDIEAIGEFHFLNDKNKTKVWGYNAHKLIEHQPGFGGTDGVGPKDLPIGTVIKEAVFEQKRDDNNELMFKEVFEIQQRQKIVKVQTGKAKVKTKKDVIEVINGNAVLVKNKKIETEEIRYTDMPVFDQDGNPVMEDYKVKVGEEPIMVEVSQEVVVQPAGVDQAKRVPLLEAAIHNLILRIEELESKLP